MVETKKVWYKSRTLLVNILVVAIGILSYAQGELTTGGVITVAGVVNVILRIITSEKLVK